MRTFGISFLWIVMLAGLLIGPFAGAGHATAAPTPGCIGTECAQPAHMAAAATPCPDADSHGAGAAPCDRTGCFAQTFAIGAPDATLTAADRVVLTVGLPVEERAPKGRRAENPDRPPAI